MLRFLSVLFLVFLVLKLVGYITWSWVLVFAPLIAIIVLWCVSWAIVLFVLFVPKQFWKR